MTDDTDDGGVSRRSVLAAVGLAATIGVGLREHAGTATTTSDETTTPPTTEGTATTTEQASVVDVELPENVTVGEPLTVDVTVENPSGADVFVLWSVRVIDVQAEQGWGRTYSLNGSGETFRETVAIEYGTHHETTLLVEPGAASISILGGDGHEHTTDFQRVEVTDKP